MTEPWRLWFDGLCEPTNPGGWMGWGYVIISPAGEEFSAKGIIKRSPLNTNNIAEYYALGFGLRRVVDLMVGESNPHLQIFGDSKLVICQFTGEWQCKAEHLRRLRGRCLDIAKSIGNRVSAQWIPREQNESADALSRSAYFEATGQYPPERRKGAA